jgi:diamine N-acetyltransferase
MMTGENILLRALEPEDVDTLYLWENDPQLWPVSNTVAPFSRFALEQYVMNAGQDIYSARQLRLMIVTRESGKSAGTIDLFDFDPANHRAGIGIMIAGEHRKKGFAAEALKLMINYSRHTLRLHQLYCNITPDNADSLRLFQNHGFEIAGLKKQWLKRTSGWADEYFLQYIFQD